MTLRLLREFIIHFKSDHKSDELALFVGEIRFNMKQLFNIQANMIANPACFPIPRNSREKISLRRTQDKH